MALQRINPSGLAQPRGFTHVVKAGNTVYVAGQTGRTSSGIAGPDITSQTDQTFKNLQTALASAGASFKDLTKITVFLTHEEDMEGFRAVRTKHLGDSDLPASTLLIVSALASPEYRVEVEGIAVIT